MPLPHPPHTSHQNVTSPAWYSPRPNVTHFGRNLLISLLADALLLLLLLLLWLLFLSLEEAGEEPVLWLCCCWWLLGAFWPESGLGCCIVEVAVVTDWCGSGEDLGQPVEGGEWTAFRAFILGRSLTSSCCRCSMEMSSSPSPSSTCPAIEGADRPFPSASNQERAWKYMIKSRCQQGDRKAKGLS